MRWAAIFRAIAPHRLVVVLEALEKILDAGMALGVDGREGAGDDGGRGTVGKVGMLVGFPRDRAANGTGCCTSGGHGQHRRHWARGVRAPEGPNMPERQRVRAWNRSPTRQPPCATYGVDVRGTIPAGRRGAQTSCDHVADADAGLDVGRRANLAEDRSVAGGNIGIEGSSRRALARRRRNSS